jgi:hypothetical protein
MLFLHGTARMPRGTGSSKILTAGKAAIREGKRARRHLPKAFMPAVPFSGKTLWRGTCLKGDLYHEWDRPEGTAEPEKIPYTGAPVSTASTAQKKDTLNKGCP